MIVVPITIRRFVPCFRLLCTVSYNRSCTVDSFLSQILQINLVKSRLLRGISRHASEIGAHNICSGERLNLKCAQALLMIVVPITIHRLVPCFRVTIVFCLRLDAVYASVCKSMTCFRRCIYTVSKGFILSLIYKAASYVNFAKVSDCQLDTMILRSQVALPFDSANIVQFTGVCCHRCVFFSSRCS
jgi:hypothetical protein